MERERMWLAGRLEKLILSLNTNTPLINIGGKYNRVYSVNIICY